MAEKTIWYTLPDYDGGGQAFVCVDRILYAKRHSSDLIVIYLVDGSKLFAQESLKTIKARIDLAMEAE